MSKTGTVEMAGLIKGAAEPELGLAALTTIMLAMAQGDCGSPYSENGNMHVWDASG